MHLFSFNTDCTCGQDGKKNGAEHGWLIIHTRKYSLTDIHTKIVITDIVPDSGGESFLTTSLIRSFYPSSGIMKEVSACFEGSHRLPTYVVLHATSKFSALSRTTLREAAMAVLTEEDVERKALKTIEFVKCWRDGSIYDVTSDYVNLLACPSEPCRPKSNDQMVPIDSKHESESESVRTQLIEAETKKLKSMYKKNTIECTVHAIANAESYAVDLFWDLIARYTVTAVSSADGATSTSITLPREFYDNMTYIANQEAEHFLSWFHRLQEMGYPFGTFPLSKGLWQSAGDTSGARFCAVYHCTKICSCTSVYSTHTV